MRVCKSSGQPLYGERDSAKSAARRARRKSCQQASAASAVVAEERKSRYAACQDATLLRERDTRAAPEPPCTR
jgi:hypothetical protein